MEFSHLVEKYYSPLYRFALSLSRKELDAGDLTQQAFYVWATKGYQLRDPSKVKTWLFTTSYREFLATKRHEQHYIDLDEDIGFVYAPQMEASMANALDGAIIQDALSQLDIRYRAPGQFVLSEATFLSRDRGNSRGSPGAGVARGSCLKIF